MKIVSCFRTATLFVMSGAFCLAACTGGSGDEAIQQRVNEELERDRAGAALHATVDKGIVTITGECKGHNCAEDLADKVKKMPGVKEVQMNVMATE